MMLDVLSFLAMADQSLGLPFARQTNSLSGTFDIVTLPDSSGYGQWKHVKNPQGWPWDLKLYDNEFIYDWVTGDDAHPGPRNFKKFVGNHLNADDTWADGLIMFPRWVDSANETYQITIPASQATYATVSNCTLIDIKSLGVITQRLHGPFLIDHGGDVGPQPTLIHQYDWSNNGVLTREENYYALHYGWTAWKLQTLNVATGMYVPVKATISNTLAKGTPVIDFPCF